MALLKTSNPALSGDAFRVGAALFGDRMIISGTVNKTGILLICVVATGLELESVHTLSSDCAAASRCRRHWGVHRRTGNHIQEGLVSANRANVRATGRLGTGQRLRHAGDTFPRDRHAGSWLDVWQVGGITARLPLRDHPRDR